MQSFFDRLERRCRASDSLLCVGLDPRPMQTQEQQACAEMLELNKRLIEATARYTACFKPNVAFYERFGPAGIEVLEQTCAAIPSEIPIILDAKRGDIGATATAYADAVARTGAGAVTVSGYLGREAIEPFLARPEAAVFVLVRTSNLGADEIQALWLADTHPRRRRRLFEELADRASRWSSRVGMVVAGNESEALGAIRRAHPDVWLLAPGIGAQGGSATDAVAAGLRSDRLGVLVAVSRSVAESPDPGAAARALRDEINAARAVAGSRSATLRGAGDEGGADEARRQNPVRAGLLDGLIEHRCFRTGRFTLKDGSMSPFYVDLRRVVSSPALLALVADAYVSLLEGLEFDRLAAIPVAALPLATAVALRLQVPLVYPRISAKQHGSGNLVEGEFSEGERVVLLDDVITSGVSKLEAVGVLREHGLQVTDLVVLLERGSSGRHELEVAGVMLHAYANIRELLDRLRQRNEIGAEQHAEMLRYLAASGRTNPERKKEGQESQERTDR